MGTETKVVGRTLSPVNARVKPLRDGSYRVLCGHAEGRCPGSLGVLTAAGLRDPRRRRLECPNCGRRNDIPEGVG